MRSSVLPCILFISLTASNVLAIAGDDESTSGATENIYR